MEYTTYDILKFKSGEIEVTLNGNSDLLFCKLYKDLNLSFTAAIIAITKLRKSIKSGIRLLMPFMPMSRSQLHSTIDILQSLGVVELFTVDPHREITKNGIKIHNISLAVEVIRKVPIKLNDLVIVSPDSGGYKRAKNVAEILNCNFICLDKIRVGNSVKHILHDRDIVENRPLLIVDDIIDSGATINSAAQELAKCNVTSIDVVAIHGIFSTINLSSKIRKIYITNTIDQKLLKGVTVINIDEIVMKKVGDIISTSNI
jgi:ribose-phosphate pyrophosphokinase